MAIRKYQPPPVPRDPTLGSMPRPSQQPYQVPSRPTPLRPTGYQVPQRPTTNFWKQRNPPEWGQVQRPIMRKWSPDYQPSYWENPVNIARHYWQLKNRPASEGVPDWIDEKSLDIAYRYMTHIQGSDDWVNWKHINPEDPVRQFLQGMDQPPLDYLLSPADFQRWTIHEMGQTDPENWTPEMMGALSPEMRAQYEQYRETWAQKTPFEELPTWQQLSYHIQSSPALSGAATMVPFAAIGGIGGMAASPVGAFFGAAIPLALGAGLGSAAAKYPSAANLLNKLDFLAEGTERAIGMGLQVEGALMNEETYGSLQEIMDNLPAAWDASTLTYTTGAFGGGRDTGINIGSQKDERLDITNVFPAVEYAFRYITGNEPEIIQFAGGQEVFPRIQVVLDEEGQQYAIGDTGPVEMDAVGLSALVQARRQMIAGADPEQVIAEYTDRFGFSAEFAELAGHMALDPLNILPKLSAKGVATVGRVTDNIPLARAFENAQGPVQGWKQYGNFIRTGLAGPVDELTAAQKFIGGLNEQGIIKELNPENVPTNPINRAYLWMRNMTPDAKARTYTSTMADNLSNMLDFRRGDFNGQISLMREMINSDPAQVAKIAPFLGSPEFATMRQSLASFGKKLDELDALWNTSAPQRDMLHGIARILDDEVPSVLKELHADGAESLYQRLVNKINDTDPELARSLAEDAALGEFTPESLQRLAEAYTGDNPIPWHPDEAAARLWGAFNEHNMDWSIKAYGVEPSKGMTRFFDTLKRGQSVVLLGFNPAYAINNGVNNAVTRAATGIFGYSTPGTIGKFFDRFGYEPYRFEAGVGAAGITPEIKLGISEYEQAIGQRIGSVGQTGEEIIRSATHTPDGKIRQGIDWVNKFGFANKLSSSLERLESQQAFHKGLRQFVDNNWVRGKGFETIPSPLRNSLEQFGSGTAERVMRALEGSLSKEEALSKIYGEVVRYDPDMHIRDVFREFGVDEGVGREALGGIYDDISERLQTAKTPDDVRRTFDEVRRNVDDYLDQQLADELGTRIEQVTTQVGSGGYAEAMHVFIEHELHMAELNTQHFMAWDETFLKAEELRAQGANPEAVSALFEGQKTRANRLWRRARKFERASMRGILEGFGLESTDARRYTVGMDGMSRRWDDYFELVNRERNDFRRTEFETPELREVEYQRMQDRHMEYYDTAIGDVKGIQTGLDELFSEMNRGAFGDDAARAALEYRMRMAELSDTRYQMQRAHREATMHEPADVRRRASADFFNNEYVPFIQEYFRQEIEAAGQYGQSVTGDIPTVEFVRPEAPAPGAAPEAAPQAGQAPPAPEVINVPPAETPPVAPRAPGEIRIGDNVNVMRRGSGTVVEEMSSRGASDRWKIRFEDGKVETHQGTAIMRQRETPPTATPPPSTPEIKAEVFAIAQEYGIEGTRIENGQTRFNPGAKTHILNTVKQIDPSIQHFDEITPELARTAFDARETRHAAQDTFAAMVDEITKKYGGMDPAEADAMRARKLGVSMDQYLSNAIDDLPEPTRQLMQTNADLMRQEFEAAQRKLDSVGKGVPITDAEGYVTGGVTYGYPVWYQGISKYINIDGQKIRGYDAVQRALEILATGEGFPARNYKIFDDLKKVGLANHYSSIDEAIAAGLMPAVEQFFQTGTWLDEIGQFQEQLATAILSDPEAAAKMGTDFIALVEDAPLEIQTEFAGLIDEVYNSIGRATESALETMDAPRLPAPDADAIVPVGLDPDEYLWFMQQAAENRNNLAHIVDESSRMVDEATPFPDQSPGEWRADMDGAKVDPEKTLALIESPTREVTPYGPYPPGVVENILQPKYESIHQGQAWAERVTPMLDALEHKLIASAGEGFSLGGKELPPSLKTGLDRYLDGVWKDMSTNKLAGIKWAENLRDQALLNYSQKRGIDTAFQWAFPYMFWYTRSMYQWALRAIDRPAWFANYARARNFMTNRMQVPGFPSRLANKMAVPAPYLPPWAGGNVWVDPVRKLFPIEEFVGPVDYYAKSKSEADRRAESLIVQMQGRGEITAQEASEAFTSRSGKVWERAQAKVQASIQGEQAAPESWMNLIMSPALYLTLPAQLLTGKAPESPLPITRTGNALKAVTENTPLHMVGQVVGSVLSAPENMLRGAAGISEFGEWGDYYVELMLSNMVSEGLLDLDEAIQQMIEKQGPAYEEAVSRTQLEQAFKVPGSLPTYAALHGASAAEFMSAMAFGWLPAGLFPEGELEQRGLAERYKHAREQYNLGDHAALGEFLDEHPELESRMALYDEPDERMRQFMITKVWNLYSDLSGVDKQEARNMFGELFETGFLSNETRNYDLLDTETLAFWANAMGGQVPETEQTIGVLSDPDFLQTKLETAPPLEAAAVDAYRSIRNDNFPNWYALQNAYFSLEKDKRRDFLQRFPELGEYWDWNRGYKESNPVIDKYVKRPDNDDIPVTYDLSFVQDFSPALTRQLFSHYNANTTMTGGTLEEMMYYWNANGRPGGDFEEFIEKVLRDAFAPQ